MATTTTGKKSIKDEVLSLIAAEIEFQIALSTFEELAIKQLSLKNTPFKH